MEVTQGHASGAFGVPEVPFYVCDGKRECGGPSCLDHSDPLACHHTSDAAHALYADHDTESFARYPSTRDGGPVTACVEPFRG